MTVKGHMRILHINLEHGWRGGERQTLYLMKGLRELGYDNHLLVRKNGLILPHARSNLFNATPVSKPFCVHGRLLQHFDIIHAHEARGHQLAVLWKHFHKRPIVFTRRVDNRPGSNPFTRLKYHKTDQVITISEYIRSVIVEWGIDPDLVTVIPSAVSFEDRTNHERVEALRDRFWGRKVVGCVAALEPRKDHHTLLETAALVKRERSDVLFVLVGDGMLRKNLETKAGKLGLHNTIFEGPQDDPYSYYPLFDLFLITSRSEGLGTAVLDAFFYRVPVVATAAGGIPELVASEQTGLLAPIGDSRTIARHLLRMLTDPELASSCTTNAYALLERKFSIPAMAGSYDQVYRRLNASTAW